MFLLFKAEISRYEPDSVTAQTSLCQVWVETPKTMPWVVFCLHRFLLGMLIVTGSNKGEFTFQVTDGFNNDKLRTFQIQVGTFIFLGLWIKEA